MCRSRPTIIVAGQKRSSHPLHLREWFRSCCQLIARPLPELETETTAAASFVHDRLHQQHGCIAERLGNCGIGSRCGGDQDGPAACLNESPRFHDAGLRVCGVIAHDQLDPSAMNATLGIDFLERQHGSVVD